MKKLKTFESYINEADEIDPKSVQSDDAAIDSVVKNKRNVAWVNSEGKSNEEFEKYIKSIGLDSLRIYPDVNSKEAKSKIKDLSTSWSKEWSTNYIKKEYMVFKSKNRKQAEAAKKELLRRGGYWNLDTAESDIYMGRLMGYGEKYILPYIEKYYPSFNAKKYMDENPKKDILK